MPTYLSHDWGRDWESLRRLGPITAAPEAHLALGAATRSGTWSLGRIRISPYTARTTKSDVTFEGGRLCANARFAEFVSPASVAVAGRSSSRRRTKRRAITRDFRISLPMAAGRHRNNPPRRWAANASPLHAPLKRNTAGSNMAGYQ
jgi:hypothetical protein